MKEEQYKRLEKYEGLANAWIKAVRQDPDLTIAEFLGGRVEVGEKEESLEAICDYITYHYAFVTRVTKGMLGISEILEQFMNRSEL